MRKFLFFLVFINTIFATILRYATIQGPLTLDPARVEDSYTSEVISNVYEGLVGVKGTRYEIEPILAESWKKDSTGKVWTFKLRKGVKFHDGTEFDAEAVIFSIKRLRALNPRAFRNLFPYFKSIKKLDRYTVKISHTHPDAVFLYNLSMPNAFIVSPNSVKGKPFSPIGTGPFRAKEWKKGESILLKTFKGYWNKPPGIDGVLFIKVSASMWRLLQLKNGNADVIKVSSTREYTNLKNLPGIRFVSRDYINFNFIGFNVNKPPFDKREVREAFAHIINKEKLVRFLFRRSALPALSLFPPFLNINNANYKDYDYDISKARRLLSSAGYPHGLKCRLYSITGRYDLKNTLLKIKKNAKKAGIEIQLVFLPFNDIVRGVLNNKYDLFAMGWTIFIPDPSVITDYLFLSQSEINFFHYRNPELDRILINARRIMDPSRRAEEYKKVQNIIHRDVILIPLYYSSFIAAYRKGIKGLHLNSRGLLIFKNAHATETVTTH